MAGFKKYSFPPLAYADPDGLLAMGGDLSPDRLLSAYYAGIFPWFNEDQPILWWSPDPRMVLFPKDLHISKSMRQLFNQQRFQVTFNQDFLAVISNCSKIYRKGQDGTWITEDIVQAYLTLHKLGFVHSVEVWEEGKLVGGLYGVYLKDKKVFCGESMFAKVSNASKYGFITWVQKLIEEDIQLIDCQIYTDHLASLGAAEIPRSEFVQFLQ